MYASNFDYLRAASIAEAGELLRQHPGAKMLAGGHSLIPMLKLRLTAPSMLVDIGRIAELKGISVVGGALRIGALTTHAELAASPLVREQAPALAEAAGHVGDPAVRNRGTIGGNVAHADPASDLPTVLTALDARFELVGEAGVTTCTAGDVLSGHDDDCRRRARHRDGDRDSGRNRRAGHGLRQVRSSGVALRGHWRRRRPDDRGRPLHRGGGGGGWTGAESGARVVGRAGARRSGAVA